MALTPEDVVNKRFQPTKFREGYDQDEVDDFLDEVVVELRRLTQENDELKQRLAGSESRIAELQRSGASAAAAPVEKAAKPAPAAEAEPAYDEANDPASTNSLLQLARRLHEEHVREGLEKRDSLIAEGHATAARVVAEAESKQRAQLGVLEEERTRLEHEIDDLRTFEREYRQKLRGYIEGQLRDLEASASAAKPSGGKGSGSASRAGAIEPGAATGKGSGPVSTMSNAGSEETSPAFPGFAN